MYFNYLDNVFKIYKKKITCYLTISFLYKKKIICKNINKNLGHELCKSSLILLDCSRDF